MKKYALILLGIVMLGALAFGAVKTYMISPKTVSSTKELLEIFFEARTTLPPLPSPVPYEEVMTQLAEGSMDFVAHSTWAYAHNAGTYYLAYDSAMARDLPLPMQLIACANDQIMRPIFGENRVTHHNGVSSWKPGRSVTCENQNKGLSEAGIRA